MARHQTFQATKGLVSKGQHCVTFYYDEHSDGVEALADDIWMNIYKEKPELFQYIEEALKSARLFVCLIVNQATWSA